MDSRLIGTKQRIQDITLMETQQRTFQPFRESRVTVKKKVNLHTLNL